jgi:hypothetical protein
VSNLDRVLRLVGTVKKNDIDFTEQGSKGEPRPVYLEVQDLDRLYNPSDVDDLLDRLPEPEPPKACRDSSGQPYPECQWFNENNLGGDVLKKGGSTLVRTHRDGTQDWRRPGKLLVSIRVQAERGLG